MTRLFENLNARHANTNAPHPPVMENPQFYMTLPKPWNILPTPGNAERMHYHKEISKLSTVLKFNGSHAQYANWRKAFIMYVHTMDITIIGKLTQMHKALDNPKLHSIIAGAPLTETGYQRIIRNLETQYGQHVDIVAVQINELQQLRSLTGTDTNAIWDFLNKVGTYQDSLIAAQRHHEYTSPNTLRLFQSCFINQVNLNYSLQTQLNRKSQSVKGFLKYIKALANARTYFDETRAYSLNQTYSSNRSHMTNTEISSEIDQENLNNAIFYTAKDKVTQDIATDTQPRSLNNARKCDVCKKDMHRLKECEEFLKHTPNERRDLLAKLNRCFRCLRKGHIIPNCDRNIKCKECPKTHNTLIHGSTPRVPQRKQERIFTTIEYEEQQSSSEPELDQEGTDNEIATPSGQS